MPTELEELVGFLANPNAQIRLLAAENLVGYSDTQPSIFKTEELKPVTHLKLLVRDHPKIGEHVITILINLSSDREVLQSLAGDEKFLDLVFERVTDPAEPNANLLSMLLANLAKWDGMKAIVKRKRSLVESLCSDELVINQLVDLFVKGADGSFNKHADFDYLAYLFADLAKYDEIRQFFITRQEYDEVVPLNKIKVFTEHKSDIRRKGVANTIKNVAFDVHSHSKFLDDSEVNILPYVLLPITGNEQYDEEETMSMLPDLQLLSPDKQRDPDPNTVQTHVETLMLLTTTREGRDMLREIQVYPIVRETHLRVDDDGVREACERLVQVLMAEEAGEEKTKVDARAEVEEDDERIIEI